MNTKSISLNGTDQYLTGGNYLDNPSAFTVEAWVKCDAVAAGHHSAIVCKGNWTTLTGWDFYLSPITGDTTHQRLRFQVMNIGTNYYNAYDAGNNIVNDGEWHHIAGVWNNTSPKIYLDAIDITSLDGGYPTGGFSNAQNVVVGDTSDHNTDRKYAGLIDEVRLWSVAKTQAEIQASMNTELTGSETGLEAYWKFNNSLEDETSNNRDLTGSGSPTYSTDVPFIGGGITTINPDFLLMGV